MTAISARAEAPAAHDEAPEAAGRFVAQPASRKAPARLPASLDDEWEEY